MNANGQLLETLIHSEVFQNYERAYAEATGMPVALRPVETWQLPLHGRRRENPFCALMAEKSRACSACLLMQKKLAQSAASGPCTMTCDYGLCEIAVPVKLGAQTLGFLQTGQVMRQTLAAIGRTGARAALLPSWYDVDRPADLERLRRELDATPAPHTGPRAPRTAALLRRLARSGRIRDPPGDP